MTQTFKKPLRDPMAERYWADLESALMAAAMVANTNLPPERQKALHRAWLYGTFNAAAHDIQPEEMAGNGDFGWVPEGDGFRLLYRSRYGLVCPLARIYPQEDGTWAALIVAGVRDSVNAAMEAAEWGVSRLTAE